MANQIDASKRTIYAQQAFSQLYNALGMANAVTRDFENVAQEKGDTISIDKPSAFSAGDVSSGSDSNDYNTDKITINLNNWKGVQANLSDKELTEVSDNFIQNHINPAAYAVANKIDQDLNGLYYGVPWYRQTQGTDDPKADVIQTRKIMVENKVPNDPNKYFELGPERYAAALDTNMFTDADKSADDGQTQVSGLITDRFGFNFFENQNVTEHSPGTLTADGNVALDGNYSVGATEVTLKDSNTTSLSGDVKKGDILEIAGNTQHYAAAEDASASANKVTVKLVQPLEQDYSDGAVVTMHQESTKTEQNLAFHSSAFALVMRPLPRVPDSSVITDPVSGLSMRLAMWYDGNSAQHKWRLDALWGVKILDGNRAVRYES